MTARRDRLLVGSCFLLVACLIAVLALWSPRDDDDAVSSYGTDTHGAKAAFLLLRESGYGIERWTRPLGELPGSAQTVLILVEPANTEANRRAAKEVLDAGGRVLATGLGGAAVLPGASAAPGAHGPAHNCKAIAKGAGPLASAHEVDMTTEAAWTGSPDAVSHRCEGLASVASYAAGLGRAVWWASPLPLENGTIGRENDVELLLASVGLRGARVVWSEAPDEPPPPSLWQYARGTPLHLVWWQLALVGSLALWSFARRGGPLRPDPLPSRAATVEFVSALGALYGKAHATNAAVTLAYRGFLDRVDRFLPVRRAPDAAAVAALLGSRFGAAAGALAPDLQACEAALWTEPMPVERALTLLRALHDCEHSVTARPKANNRNTSSENNERKLS